LWEARLRFGPHVRGPLTIARDPDAWRGEIAGRVVPVKLAGDTVTLTLGEGSYTGRFDDGRTRIVGHWIQPATVTSGTPYACPVTLTKSRRIVSEEWARRATSPLQRLGRRGGYGYLWWLDERPYKGRTVKTYLAGGNGSQVAMAVPELDLVIGFWGGNYSGTTGFIPQDVYVPEWILPAVQDRKNLTGS